MGSSYQRHIFIQQQQQVLTFKTYEEDMTTGWTCEICGFVNENVTFVLWKVISHESSHRCDGGNDFFGG